MYFDLVCCLHALYKEMYVEPSSEESSSRVILIAELFNKCLKESCFPDCWNVSSVVAVFKNVGERSTAKNYCPVSLLSVVSKVFEKLVNNRIVDPLEKCVLFSDFQYGFSSSRSTHSCI